MRIAKKTHYGLQILTFFALHPNESWSLSALADELKIPFSFTKHIAAMLKRQGLLDSRGGARGGYRLAKQSDRIRLSQVFRALDEEISFSPCRTKHCSHKTCLTGRFWETVAKKLQLAFEQSTLDLVLQAQSSAENSDETKNV